MPVIDRDTAEFDYLEALDILQEAVELEDDVEDRAERINAAQVRLKDVRQVYKEAIKAKKEADNAPAPGELIDRTSFGRFMRIAGGDENWDGAERELQEELFGEKKLGNDYGFFPGAGLRNMVPIEALGFAPQELQKRADAITNPDTQLAVQTRPIAQQVFNNAITGFMGVDMITVPAGEQKFSWITAGATAGVRKSWRVPRYG